MLRYDQLNYSGKVAYHTGGDAGRHHELNPALDWNHAPSVAPPAANQTNQGSPQSAIGNNVGGSEILYEDWKDPNSPNIYSVQKDASGTVTGFATEAGRQAYSQVFPNMENIRVTNASPPIVDPLLTNKLQRLADFGATFVDAKGKVQPTTFGSADPTVATPARGTEQVIGGRVYRYTGAVSGSINGWQEVDAAGNIMETEWPAGLVQGGTETGPQSIVTGAKAVGSGAVTGASAVGRSPLTAIEAAALEDETNIPSVAPDAKRLSGVETVSQAINPEGYDVVGGADKSFYEDFVDKYRNTVIGASEYQMDEATKAELERIATIPFPHQQYYEEVMDEQGNLQLQFTAWSSDADMAANPELAAFRMSPEQAARAEEMVSLKNQARQKLNRSAMIESEAAMTDAQRAQIYGGPEGQPTIAQQQMAQGQTQFEAAQAQSASQFSQQQQLGYYQTEVGVMEGKAGRDLQREIATNQQEWTEAVGTYERLRESMEGGQYIDPSTGATITVAGALSDLQQMQTKKNELTAEMIETQYELENVNIAARYEAESALGIDVLSIMEKQTAQEKGLISARGTEERKGITLSKQWDYSIQELQNSGAMERLTKQIEADATAAGIRMTHEEAAQQAELNMRELLAQNSLDAAKENLSTQGEQALAQIEAQHTNTMAQQAAQIQAKETLAGRQITHEQAMNDARLAAQEAAVVTGGEQERLTLREQQAIAGEIRQEYAITATSEAVEVARQNTSAYMTQLGTAMTNSAATEDGDTTAISEALQMELPPTPAGIVWDTTTATFSQRPGFEGREMDKETQQWIAAASPAFRARDRAEQVVRETNRLRQEMVMRTNERRIADEDFRQAMLTGDIDSAEEAVARQRIAETRQLEQETKNQNITMLLNLLANPMQLSFAKKYGLLGQIEASLGFNISNVTVNEGISGIPNVNEWGIMDNEQKQFSIAEYIEQGGTVDEFMRLVAGNAPAQMQQLQYVTV